MHKRPASGIWGGLWGFYESLMPPQETSDEALGGLPTHMKQLLKQSEAKIEVMAPFTHTFSHFHLHISPVLIELKSNEHLSLSSATLTVEEPGALMAKQPQANNDTKAQWFNIQQVAKVGLAAPTVKIIKQLQSMY